MKLPQTPPDVGEILATQNKSMEIMHLADQIGSESEYFHWDDLRRRPVLEGVTHKDWWALLKIQRKARYRRIPLLDGQGKPFQYFIPDNIQKLLHEIDSGAGATIGIQEPIANPQMRDRYMVSSLIEEAITSSQLEGAATTREVAKEMIRSGRKPRDKSEQMILNNYFTMQEIIADKDKPLTVPLLLGIQRRVTERTLDNPSAAGRFRRADERVMVVDPEGTECHVPPPADELEQRVQKMCTFANGRSESPFIPPVIRAIILHFWLAYDHPFVDGNGRTARALFYWSMLRQGFKLFEFISISNILVKAPVRYARAFLHTETDDNDLNYFILHQAEVIRLAITSLHDYLDRKRKEVSETESRLHAVGTFNHRQQALLTHALRHPGQQYSIESHRKSHNVAYATARADLFGLHGAGLLQRTKRGKTMIFAAAPDLVKTLDAMSRFVPADGAAVRP